MKNLAESGLTGKDEYFGQKFLGVNRHTNSVNNIASLSKARIPKWVESVTTSLYAIVALCDNWDSYGAKRISHSTAVAVQGLLQDIMHDAAPAPQLVPGANGNVQIEWHFAGIDLEVEVESQSLAHVFFYDHSLQESAWEGRIENDLSRLVHYIDVMARRAHS